MEDEKPPGPDKAEAMDEYTDEKHGTAEGEDCTDMKMVGAAHVDGLYTLMGCTR
jgi:hypothetical protein